MTHDAPAYGPWTLVALNSLVFSTFALSFGRPQSLRGWRSLSAFSGFIVVLFAEVYGFPLTIYLPSGRLQARYPGVDIVSHDAGHLWSTIFGLKRDPHSSMLHILSHLPIGGGFLLLSSAWNVLHQARRKHRLAATGAYAHLRHPQCVAFIAIMFGLLLQWPTLLTLLMFPVLVGMYVRLARTEEREARGEFGAEYERYAARVPAWLPRLGGHPPMDRPSTG